MMRWLPFTLLRAPLFIIGILAATLLSSGIAFGEIIPNQETYQRAGRDSEADRRVLQRQIYADAYYLASGEAVWATRNFNPTALEALDRTILWPVERSGEPWPLLDHAKNQFGWQQWPRIEYDSRWNGFINPQAFLSAGDRESRILDWHPARDWPGGPLEPPFNQPLITEGRLPLLLLEPIWTYYRMHGKFPATPGDAYREVGIAIIDAAERELLDHYTPVFYADDQRLQLRLTPLNPAEYRLEANAWFDPTQTAFVLESRRLLPHELFADRVGREWDRTPSNSCGLLPPYRITPGPELPVWSTWRYADIPVIATPVTDFLRYGPRIKQVGKELTQAEKDLINASLHGGPYFENTDSTEKGK